MSNIITDTLTARRLEWIRTLESGTYRQGNGSLFRQSVEYTDGLGFEDQVTVVAGTQEFCCLGVARDVPTGGEWSSPITEEEFDEPVDNEWVSDYYGIPEKMRFYLMGMNDGDSLAQISVPNSYDCNYALSSYLDSTKRIRYSRQEHDFPFIARFLRKVWGLTGA